MDIQIYEDIKNGLKNYIQSLELSKAYNPDIVGYEPSNPNYPLVKFKETRNVPYTNYRNYRETVANLGYSLDIYAKTSNSIKKDEIARTLAKHCDKYLTCIGLKQMSWNVFENDGQNGDLYHIIIMYNTAYLEQRQFIL